MNIDFNTSKAEQLVGTADSLKELNPNIAKEHLNRFMTIIRDNKIEMFRFDAIQNIVYGYVLAIRLNMIDENYGNQQINEFRFRFISSDHLRYENGVHVAGPHGGAGRGIEIFPNYQLNEGFIVAIHGIDVNNPFWSNNYQMAPKQMKIIEKASNRIELRGFGKDPFGNTFENHGMTIHFKNYEVEQIISHMHAKGVDIKYLP